MGALLLGGCELPAPEPVCTLAYNDCEDPFSCHECTTADGKRFWQCGDGWQGEEKCAVEHHCFPSFVAPCDDCRNDCCEVCVESFACGDTCVYSASECPPETPDEGCACNQNEVCVWQ